LLINPFAPTAAGKGSTKLQPDKWLNDCLIDFWMLWITRKEPSEENWIRIFNTHFYTSMVDNGVDHMLKWTEKKN
jgi:Ulp1 family protease